METLYPESWQVPPMKYCSKVSDLAAKRAFDSGEWIGQEKKDGALYCLEKTNSGYVYLFSRTKSRKTGELVEKSENFPHIKEWAEMFVPNGTIFIGEIYIPGGHSNTVTKLSGCLPAKAYKRQFDRIDPEYLGPAHFYIFDIIRYRGENIQEKGTLDRIENYLYNESLEYIFADQKYIERAETFYDNFEKHLQRIFNEGGEGIVFKNKSCPYRAGKRSTSSQMFKWKRELDTIDVVCIGFEKPNYYYEGKEPETWKYKDSDGKLITRFAYYNYPAAIKIGLYKNGKVISVGTVSSGLNDEERADIRDNPSEWLNQVIECKAMSISGDNAFRHCVFIQKRNDKNPEECLYENIFN